MEVTLVSVRKLQIAFDNAWKKVSAGERPESVGLHTVDGPLPAVDFWTCYMNSLDCLVIDKDDLLENFDEMVNFGNAVKTSVCVKDPCYKGCYVLVPKDVAEKAVVLGGLP